MAKINQTHSEKNRQSSLILFIGVCSLMIVLTLYLALAESQQNAALQNISAIAGKPTATLTPTIAVTIDPNVSPTPTLEYWETQE